MTMATNITKEEDNFLRIVYLNYRVGTTALRRFFDNVHPNLPSDLSSPTNISILSILHKPPKGQRRVLYQEQWDILYPPSGSHVVSSVDLDVTLMVCLLRNLPPKVNPPINGFDALPQSTDMSRGAHIARIKYYKNFLVSHSKDGKISDTDFNIIWIDLEMAIIGLGNQHDVKDAAEAKSKSLDYNSLQELVHIDTRLNYHTNEIAKQTSKIEKLETTVEAMEKEVQLVKKDLQVGTPNDFMIERITSWEKDDIQYIETRATKHVLSCVSKYKCVSVIGPSGCGKTALVRHVALQLKRNGYTILTVIEAKQIKEYYKSERKTMYIVDDVCGNFTANQARLDEWKKSKTDIEEILQSGNCKLVLTCRLQVFQDKGFENLKTFKTCICNITSTDLSLTYEEKEQMTTEYFGEHAIKALAQLGKYDCLPLLCKLYHVLRNVRQFKLEKFLNEPFSFYEEDLTCMKNDCKEGKYKYCALFLLVIFNNNLKEKQLTGKDPKVTEIIEDILEECEIDEHITGRTLKSQLEILTGTFVTYEVGIYQTIHDKLFDFLAYYFGTQANNIDILIKHAKDRFVCERFVVTDYNKSTRYLISVSSDKLQMYMQRVFDDIVSSCNVNVKIRGNNNLNNVKYRTMLCDFMEHLSKDEIIAVMEKANNDFLNKMFVMKKNDIKDLFEYYNEEYKCFGIVLPDNMLQQYIKQWFGALVETKSTHKLMKNNRLFKYVAFRTALKSYMKQLATEHVAYIIQTGSTDFLNTMIVMSEDDINDFVKNQNERFCIVIPEGMVHNYIDRWFDDLTKYVGEDDSWSETYNAMPFSIRSREAKTRMVTEFINENRPLENLAFRYALRTYINQLTTEKIAFLIHTAKDSFLNTMFVMTHDDIKDHAENRYEWFGIVIPDDLLQQYIVKYFDGLTNKFWLVDNIHINRVINNVKGRTALRTHIKQLNSEKIASLIQNSAHRFFNTMFVIKEEDIQNKQCFCILIPDDLLQLYIKRWLDDLTKTSWVEDVIEENSLFINVTFRKAIRHYISQFTTENIASIIKTAPTYCLNLMFVMSVEDINENSEKRYECFGIVIPDDLLQQYIERWFKSLTKTWSVEYVMCDSRLLKNIMFRNSLCNYIRQLDTEKIAALILNADEDFINTMFVMAEQDIKDNDENRHECFGIVIPDNLLQQYMERWFQRLTKTSDLEKFINKNRPINNVTFCIALNEYVRQFNTEKIASFIWNANCDFINTMFVMAEQDIKDNAENRYECFGIVIPDNLLQQYMERWFQRLTKSSNLETFINKNRPIKNVTFRIALNEYMRQFNTEKIASFIWNANGAFINSMFIITDKDIKDNTENRYECFGIVIPDNLLQQYIERWFKGLTKTWSVEYVMCDTRLLKNIMFRTSLCNYIRQLDTEKIAYLILNADKDFINTMFVMAEQDIKDNAENRHECFGIVIPDDLLQQYIERWFKDLTKTWSVEYVMCDSRLLKNIMFRTSLCNYIRQLDTEKIAALILNADKDFINTMFVMAEQDIKDIAENRHECFGIVIPDNLLQQYMERWFQRLTKTSDLETFINKNRPIKNVTFRIALNEYMKQFNTEKIASLILNANGDFINTMFVMADKPINVNTENRLECFGIVIPDDLLQQYIERWVQCLTKTKQLETYIDKSRPLKDITFRIALNKYMKQLNTDKIASLIWNTDGEFINTMFAMAEEDIKNNTDNRYECFGIVISDDLLKQYIDRWFERLTKTNGLEKYIDKNRPMKNVTFRIAFSDYLRKLVIEKIASLIWNADGEFINTMFVMAEEDIKDNAENRVECFGIVIPGDLLQQYIERLFECLTKTGELENFINNNRPIKNVTFRIAFSDYFRQLNTEKIASIIWNANGDFINTMFVLPDKNININTENRCECFGIVIPYDLIQQYIERLFECFIKTSELEKYIDKSRPIKSVTFRTALCNYMRQLNRGKIASLILKASVDFINTMFVMTEDDIKDGDANRYECFGIVIPDNLLQQYIESLIDGLTKTESVRKCFDANRCFFNGTFRKDLQTYTKHLTRGKIGNLIRTGSIDFVNTMFVMTEDDIKEDSENRQECFGIIIPVELLHQYIGRLIAVLTKTDSVRKCLDVNRCFMNATFRISLQTYMKQLTRGKIGNLIRTGSKDFVNTMFVMTEDDIKENAENRNECFGIVIADDMLKQYFQRWFESITRSDSVKEDINENRLLMNIEGQAAIQNYIKQINEEQTGTLILTGSADFLNTMFVTTNDYIKDNAVDRYECFGIVLSDHLLQQYIGRLIDGLTKTDSVRKCLGVNRCFMNTTFRISLQTYMTQLTQGNIANLIQTGSIDFVNTMFVIAEDDIKDDDETRNECFGVIIPDDLLHLYIERWFDGMTHTDSAQQYIDGNRTFMSSTFQANLDTFISGINSERIKFLNCKGHIDYLNTRRDLLKENSTSNFKS